MWESSPVKPSDQIAAIAAGGEALAAAAETGLDRGVSSCPGWDMAKLVLHVGLVHTWAGESVRRRAREGVDFASLPRAPEGPSRVPWLRDATASLVEALGAAADGDAAGRWRELQVTPGFWRRRMALETAIHRWDAEGAVGQPEPVDAPLAVDGIGEVVELLLPFSVRATTNGPVPGTLHIHCTDAEGEWLLAVTDGRLDVTLGHAKGDAALRGGASGLFLTCWGRKPEDDPEVIGDKSVADAWLSLMGW